MPKYGRKKNPAKRTYRRKYRRYRKKLRIPAYPFTQQKLVKLRYSEYKTYTSTSGGIVSQIYRLNDLYDVDYSGIGHQSLYRDQLFAIYARARVLGVSIKIRGCSNSPYIFKVVAGPIQSGSADTNLDTAAERKGSRSQLYNPNSNGVLMKYYSTCDNYFGLSKGTTRKEDVYIQTNGGTLGGMQTMYYQILCRECTANTGSMVINVDIVQYVIFEQPLQVSSS